MVRTESDWIKAYQKKGALWIHDGNPKRPHALLASGNHSSGFFNSEIVMEHPHSLNQAASDLVELLVDNRHHPRDIDRVVGPAMGAITLAHDVARQINLRSGRQCLRAYTEKDGEGESKRMVFKRTAIQLGEFVLLVEDVLTTGGSVDLTAAAVINAGGRVAPFVAVIVNRSGLKEMGGKKILSLIDHSMPMWTPSEECPLCKNGSEAVRPKNTVSWERLNATY